MERLKVPQELIDAQPRGLSVRLYYKFGGFISGLYLVRRKNAELMHGDAAEVLNFLENYRELPPSFWNTTKTPPILEDFGDFTQSISVITFNQVTKKMCSGYLISWKDPSINPEWKMEGPDGLDLEGVSHWSFHPKEPKLA